MAQGHPRGRDAGDGPRLLNDGYFRTVAVSKGVPEEWLEECAQEMLLRLWLREIRGWKASPATVVATTAIDFSREYGFWGRSGLQRRVEYIILLDDDESGDDDGGFYGFYEQEFDEGAGPCIQALRTLGDEDYNLIVSHDLLGEPLIRQAERRGVSGGRMTQIHKRALARLREKVEVA